jgi:hypothetical protein
MNRVCLFRFCCLIFLMAIATGCSPNFSKTAPPEQVQDAAAPAYQVDPLTAGSISGMIRYIGKRPLPKEIDMSGDSACVQAHHGNALDEFLVVSSKGGLANAFVYVKSGLEGQTFATPSTPVAIDQNGCWFRPRVLGIQTNQALADYEFRSGHTQYSPHGADRPGVEPKSGSGRAAACPKVRQAGGHDPREV